MAVPRKPLQYALPAGSECLIHSNKVNCQYKTTWSYHFSLYIIVFSIFNSKKTSYTFST